MSHDNKMNLETTLPAISFDFEKLMAWAKSIAEQYHGLVVQETDIAEIKSEMAGLNKMKQKLDDVRKETVKQISVPIKTFEAQIKEVCTVFTSTRTFLAEQVQAFEDAEREKKVQHVQFQIDSVLDEHGLTGSFNIPIEPSWLNKSKTLNTVRAEVESRVLAHIKAEREKAELEQAKADRAVAIETHVKSCAAIHGFDLPVSRFYPLHDLQTPLADVHATIERAYVDQAVKNAEAAVAPVAQALEKIVQPPAQAIPQIPTEKTNRTVLFEIVYSDEQERAVETALRNLQSICVSARIVNNNANAA